MCMAVLGIVQDQLLYAISLGATSLFTLFIGLLIGKIMGRVVYRVFSHTGVDTIAKSLPVRFSPTQFFSQLITYLIDVIAIILALHVLNLAFTVIFIIIGILILASLISSFFWVKDALINIMAKICLFLRHVKLCHGQTFSLHTHSIHGVIQTTGTTTLVLKSGKDMYEIPYLLIRP